MLKMPDIGLQKPPEPPGLDIVLLNCKICPKRKHLFVLHVSTH